MENAPELKAAPTASQACCAGGGSLNRRTLYIGLGIGAAAGMFLGWDWLVAIGAASLIIALAPCLIMCAFGICAMRMCKKNEGTTKPEPVDAGAPVTKTPAANASGAAAPDART